MPKVSVIIPTYNRADLISEAIQSVLDQTFTDFEIIVIDDGSTDNTSEIITAFPVRYFYQENQGVAAARNKGIELSHGEYIAFLDSDDILMNNALEKGVDVLDKYPEASFTYGQWYIMDERGRIIGLEKAPIKYSCVRQGKEEIREFLIYGNHIPTPTVMVRRSCLDESGIFDPSFNSGSEDVDFFIRLAKRYAVAHIAEPLVKCRWHSQNFTKSIRLTEFEKTKDHILQEIFNDNKLGPLFSHLKPNAYFSLYFSLAGWAYIGKDMKTARSYLFKALKTRPRGFFKSMWLPWIMWLVKTWIPMPVLILARNVKRYLNRAMLKNIH
jgi:glycosyltransferase involved in cell wall biosynthesis